MTELAEPTPELTHKQNVARTKELGRAILDASAELETMPRAALIEAAWNSIAHYHREGETWGFDHPTIVAFEKEKDFRMSLLTEDEREIAIMKANAWLDDNFPQ